jgi:hypothetical protein
MKSPGAFSGFHAQVSLIAPAGVSIVTEIGRCGPDRFDEGAIMPTERPGSHCAIRVRLRLLPDYVRCRAENSQGGEIETTTAQRFS